MGLVTSALQIGRSALLSYQSALQVVGNNISNAGSEDYTRQSVGLSPLVGRPLPEGFLPGAGVGMTSLRRNLDEALEARLRVALGREETALVEQQILYRMESVLNELGDADLSTLMNEFFNSFNSVQNDPLDLAVRDVALASGDSLASAIRRQREELFNLNDDLNEQVQSMAPRANELASQIADLNVRIIEAESGGKAQANALHDQQDALLRELAELVELTTRRQEGGAVNVYVGNEPLIQHGFSRGFTTTTDLDGQLAIETLRFADDNSEVELRGGELAGLSESGRHYITDQMDRLDQLAEALISEVNRVHSSGQGLVGFSSTTGSYDVLDTSAALDGSEAGLKFPPVNGSFYIAVTETATDTTTAAQIQVDLDGIDTDTTLQSLADDITANVANVTASITPDNRLRIDAADGFAFTFGHDGTNFREDTSGVLAALGINTFFEGTGSDDITLNSTVQNDARVLAAAQVRVAGDGGNAGRLAAVADTTSDRLNGATVFDFYNGTVNTLAVTSAAARNGVEAAEAIRSALQSQKESVSGVSLDEEGVNLLKMERAYQGAARFVTVIDRLLSELLSLVR